MQRPDGLELNLKGRVDGFWAARLAAELENVIRQGHHHLRLNLCEVSYLSSAGIGVIVKYHQELGLKDGSLVVAVASPPVKRVLEMARLGSLVAGEAMPAAALGPASRAPEGETPGFRMEQLSPRARLNARLVGSAEALRGCLLEEKHSQRIRLRDAAFGLGLGAFGASFLDCRERIGEFVAVAGSAAYQPSDGSNVPDYQVGCGEMVAACGLLCEGSFSHRASFQVMSLGEAARECLEAAGSGAAGIVALGETASGVVLAAGLVSREAARELAPLAGRFHGARFDLDRLPGVVELKTVVAELFHSDRLRAVGRVAPESLRFASGLCWVGGVW